MTKYLMMILSLLPATYMMAQGTPTGVTTQVQGTQLATLHSLMDVLTQITGVTCAEDAIYVSGRGKADVYINKRKVTDITELWHTQAGSIMAVTVIQQPGVEYDKDVRAVILVTIKEVAKDGFTLDQHLRVDLSNKVAGSEELNLGYKQGRCNVKGFVAWNERRFTILQEPIAFLYADKTHELTGANFTTCNTTTNTQQLTARFNADYDITPLHRISVGYTFLRIPRFMSSYDDQCITAYGAKDGHIDYDNPTMTPNGTKHRNEPESRHSFNAEYRGFIKRWTLYAGNNTYWDNIKITDIRSGNYENYIHTDEMRSRSYLRGELPVGNGKLQVGGEYNYNDMEVLDELVGDHTSPIHISNTNHVTAVFTSLDQQFGNWTLSAGVRYEHEAFIYKPLSGDVFGHLAQNVFNAMGGDMSKMPGWEQTIAGNIIANGEYKRTTNNLAPTVSVSTKIKASTLALSYAQTYQRPYLGLIKIPVSEIGRSEENLLKTEHVTTAMLTWTWRWVGAEATYNQYTDPLCQDTYTGPSYDALQLRVTLSPTLWKIWKPAFMAQLQKQWFEMPIANGRYRLDTPVLALQWNNTITLPHQWMIRLNADWHSRGHVRNMYYYSTNFELDAAVQKVFKLRKTQRLTLELSGDNLLHQSYTDVTTYERASSLASDGMKERKARTVSFSVRYTL